VEKPADLRTNRIDPANRSPLPFNQLIINKEARHPDPSNTLRRQGKYRLKRISNLGICREAFNEQFALIVFQAPLDSIYFLL
jgi:hypothetical protein